MKKSLLLLVSDSWGVGAEIEKVEDNLYVNHSNTPRQRFTQKNCENQCSEMIED